MYTFNEPQADPNERNSETGTSPIIEAVRRRFREIVQALLDHGASTTLCDNDGRSPLLWAAHEGDLDCVQLLHSHGSPLDIADSQQQTSLTVAAVQNHIDIVRYLVNHGARNDAALVASSLRVGPTLSKIKKLSRNCHKFSCMPD